MWNHLQQRFSVLPIQWAKTLWSRVTSSAINPDSEIGRLSRLLNGALLIIITLGIISEVEFVTRAGRFNVTDALAAATLLLLLLAYFLNRSGYFKTAAALTIGSIVFAMYAILWFNREEKDAAYILLYLIFPILMGEFLLSPRAHAVTVALILAGVAGFFPLPGTVDTFMFLAIFSALMRLTSNYRRELEKNRLQSLQEAERKYRTLVEKVPAITYINLVDKDAVPIYVSPQIQTILGVSPEEWIEGKLPFWQSLIHPDDRGLVRTNFDRLYATGESADTEYRVNIPGGRLVWIHDHAIMLWDTAGNPVSIQGVMYDVTERRQAEETIRANEKRLRALIENGQDNISLLSADGVLMWESPATIRTLGYAQDEFLGHNIFELMHPDDLHWTSDLYSKLIHKPGSREHGIFRLRHRDGTWRWNEAVVTNMLNEPGVNAIVVNYRDITELKRADAKIRQYADIVENIKLGLYVFHLEKRDDESSLRLVLANPAALRFSGTTADEVIGTYLDESFPELREMGVPQKYAEVVRTGEALELEVIYFDDFQVMDTVFAVKAFPLPDDHVGVAFENITERKKAEGEVRASEERFRQLANNIQEVFWITDPIAQKDVYISPAYEAVWGRGRESQMQNPNLFVESVLSEDKPAVLTAVEKQVHGEKTEMEYRISRPDGSVRWIWDRAFPIFDESGRVKNVAGIAADITERKQSENALRASEERFSNAFEFAPIGMSLASVDGHWLRVNQALCEITGYSSNELLEKTFRDITHPEDLDADLNSMNRVLAGEIHYYQIEKRFFHKLGHTIWVQLNVSLVRDDDGRPQYFISQTQNITERKQAEKETVRHLTELEALYENGLAVSRLLEPREIGGRIIQTFERYFSWHHVAIRLRRGESDDLELVAFNMPNLKDEEEDDVERNFNAMVSKVGQGLSGWAVQNGVPIRAGNVHLYPQYVDTYKAIMSGVYMPLKVGERIIGCISVESELADSFSVQDERLLATLANQAAIAFENARLYQAVQLELMERRRIEDELRASQERYQTLVETSPDGIGMITLGGTVLFANEKMVDLFKTADPSDLIGSNLPFLFAPEEQTRMIENLGKAISQGSDFNEYWMTRKDHTRFYGDVRIRMTRDRMGQPDKAILQIRDITERKLTQTAIQEERQHFLDMFENSPVATWLEDFGAVAAWMDQLREQGIEDLRNYLVSHPEEYKNALSMIRIIDVNQAAVKMNGAKSKTHLLENVHRLMIEETPSQSLIIEFLMLWKGHTSFEFELTNRTLEGKSINAILHIYIPFIDGKPDLRRVIVTSTDITERKQMEIALQDERNLLAMRVEERTADLSRVNDNLARALRVKDEFLANMSHELRTPLNAILGLSESLGEQIAGPLNNKQQNYVSTIGESGHHLLALINDILDLAKIEAGQITLDITKVDVHSVCQASLRMIKQQAQKKNQEVTLEIDENFGLIWADERRLKQMIVNLMSNAVKFTPENGKIGLEVHGDQGENRVLITVWDSGIGIEEIDLSQLFQPFVQLDSGLARETSGTGLGLALVAQMARLHGGSVSVASMPGEGSRFTLVIPWQPALSADTIERMKITGKFRAIKLNAEKQETILLIEDTEEVILVVRDYLELSGYNVVVAKDGLDGITQAKLIHPDLILMDLQMPRMNGIEATQKLRSDPDFQYTPIIALTALAMPNDRERCLAAGMDEYITKPVNLRALIKIIQGFLSHNQE